MSCIDINLSGVNLITGPSGAGKTLFCDAIKWGLVGSKAFRHPESVSLIIQNIGSIKRDKTSVTAVGLDAIDPALYILGVRGLFSSTFPGPQPSQVVDINSQKINVATCDLAKCKSALTGLYADRAELQTIIESLEIQKTALQSEMETLAEELRGIKEQQPDQLAACTLKVMESGECPLYPVTCQCKDVTVGKTKELYRKKLVGIRQIPGFFAAIAEKERAIADKRIRLELIEAGMPDATGKTLQMRLSEVEPRISVGEKVIECVERLAEWDNKSRQAAPFTAIKDRLLPMAAGFGIPLTFTCDKYLLRGEPVERGGRTDLVVIGYCLQVAAGLPVVIVDNFDVLDRGWKAKLVGHAQKNGTATVFIASSSVPINMPGVISWHLDGKLSKVA